MRFVQAIAAALLLALGAGAAERTPHPPTADARPKPAAHALPRRPAERQQQVASDVAAILQGMMTAHEEFRAARLFREEDQSTSGQ